jgi:hypothetical protein
MKMLMLTVCCAMMVALSVQAASPETRSVYGILRVEPMSILVSPDAEGFSVSRKYRTSYYSYRASERVDGVGSWAPMVKGGLRFDSPKLATDLTVGVGALISPAFTAPMAELALDFRFNLGSIVTLGPHLALVTMGEPSWGGNADVSFSSASGAAGGVEVTVGKKRVFFNASLSYLALSPCDVETGSGWTASSDELDFSGVLGRLGVLLRF